MVAERRGQNPDFLLAEDSAAQVANSIASETAFLEGHPIPAFS
jgi:hypothetical protein